ncbi:hypothetical protein BMAFMH_B0215, partial [Burkholderia mallei FMH]
GGVLRRLIERDVGDSLGLGRRGRIAARRGRQAARDGHRAQMAMPGRGEGVDDELEPRAVDHREHAAPAVERRRIDRDVAALRILDQLILDDVRQRLLQPRPFQRRQRLLEHQQVARGDDKHRRRRLRQQRERRAARALRVAALVDERERQLGPLPFLQRHGRLARRQ